MEFRSRFQGPEQGPSAHISRSVVSDQCSTSFGNAQVAFCEGLSDTCRGELSAVPGLDRQVSDKPQGRKPRAGLEGGVASYGESGACGRGSMWGVGRVCMA